MEKWVLASVSNGIPEEQALIRRWWHKEHGARGRLVWEYYLEGFYADAIWFPDAPVNGVEEPGKGTGRLFPLDGETIVLCEAKKTLNPELVGQAMVYSELACCAGARLKETAVFAQEGTSRMQEVARRMRLTVVVAPLEETA